MQKLEFIFNNQMRWSEHIDLKANFMLVLKMFILGYFFERAEHFDTEHAFYVSLIIVFSVASFLSFWFLIGIIYPRLSMKEGHSTSRIYFKHIAFRYENNIKSGVADLTTFGDNAYREDLAGQIIHLGRMVKSKYRSLKRSITFMGLEVFALVLLILF